MYAHSLCRVQLFASPWTVARQLPLSMGFSSKNTGVGCHFLLQEGQHSSIYVLERFR